MHINNEIGTMQPVEEIGQICAKKQAEFGSWAIGPSLLTQRSFW